MMSATSIKLDRLIITSDTTTHYGCNQDWFSLKWHQMSGCGPTVATNLLIYRENSKRLSINEAAQWMQLVRKTVTPTFKGVNHTDIFSNGLIQYGINQNQRIEPCVLELPMQDDRPSFENVVAFICEGLMQNAPVAFLNLHNGDIKALDAWHWTTIVACDSFENHTFIVTILDNGQLFEIDLHQWYQNTCRYGGFVYIKP